MIQFNFFSQEKNKAKKNMNWYIDIFPYDEKKILNNINERIKNNYYPVAFDLQKDKFYIIFVKDKRAKILKWALKYIKYSNINKEISTALLEGWSPIDISFKESGIFNMFKKANYQVNNWMTQSVSKKNKSELKFSEEIENQIALFKLKGFNPNGISYFKNNLISMYVKENKKKNYKDYKILRYKNDGNSIFLGIKEEYNKGYLPCGLSIQDKYTVWLAFIR